MDATAPGIGDQEVSDAATATDDIDTSVLDDIEAELGDVEAALARLDDGSYGTCDVCGAEIGEARLVERPTDRHCADHLPLQLG
jgi:DnaK suppressor protein